MQILTAVQTTQPDYVALAMVLALGLKLYTHRYNSFGPLHLVNLNEKWHGPGAWRTEGINWSYEYVLRTTGILKTPGIS